MNAVFKSCFLAFAVIASTAVAQEADHRKASPRLFLTPADAEFKWTDSPSSLFPSLALATDDVSLLAPSPQFSYASAEAAFDKAHPPSADEANGDWMFIGLANNPQGSIKDKEGYWPDGKLSHPSLGTGYFKFLMSIQQMKDAFGKIAFTVTRRLIGAETGKIYYTSGPDAGVMTSTGMVFIHPADDTHCGGSFECRITDGSEMMLCSGTAIAGATSECQAYHNQGVQYLGGFIRPVR